MYTVTVYTPFFYCRSADIFQALGNFHVVIEVLDCTDSSNF